MTTENKKANPKISVIITCYNYGKFIDEAIESLRNQTFKDWEAIIIDDCSTDEYTQDRIREIDFLSSRELPRIYNRFEVIQLNKSVGIDEARKIAITHAKTKYIICLDGNNKLKKNCLKKLYDVVSQGCDDVKLPNPFQL